MSSSPTDKRIDPLIDAYRQASELDQQTTGARPGAALRAAVLAHARVVAQSATTAEPKHAVSEAVRATPAANESKPVWRMVAGVVLGLAGIWVYQLTRPGTMGEANVAVMTAPQSAKSVATESAESTVAPVAPVTVGAPSPAAPATSTTATTAAHAQQEASVAVAVLPKPAFTPAPATAARETSARERASATGNSAGVSAPRDGLADAARSDTSVALATVDAPKKRAQQPASVAAPVAVAAAPAPASVAATSAIPEVVTSEPFGETAVASAETRKSARQSAVARPSVAAAPPVAAAQPNAFPATTSGAILATAPAANPPSEAAGGSAAMRQGVASAPDASMFNAIRIGNVNAFRAAIMRGANINARNEAGRSALQIARERNDAEMVKALELAGAK